jgi:hypothetical protein
MLLHGGQNMGEAAFRNSIQFVAGLIVRSLAEKRVSQG